MKFYHKQSRKLLRLCEGDQCQCMAGKLLKSKTEIKQLLTKIVFSCIYPANKNMFLKTFC